MFGQNRQNKELERQQKARMAEDIQRYKKVFSGPDGEWVLNDIAKRSFVYTTTYDPDEKKMFMNEGRRSLYVAIETRVKKDIQQILEELTNQAS